MEKDIAETSLAAVIRPAAPLKSNIDEIVDMKSSIADQINVAASGNAAAAVRLAVLIFTAPEVAAKHALKGRYQEYLLQALASPDPELLAAVGEQLYLGIKLAADAPMAYRFFKRADELSSFMGSYILARLIVPTSPSHALPLLRKGELRVHLPSRMMMHFIKSENYGWLKPIVRQWFLWLDTLAVQRAITQPDAQIRMWRYRDLNGADGDWMENCIGADQGLKYTVLFEMLES